MLPLDSTPSNKEHGHEPTPLINECDTEVVHVHGCIITGLATATPVTSKTARCSKDAQ